MNVTPSLPVWDLARWYKFPRSDPGSPVICTLNARDHRAGAGIPRRERTLRCRYKSPLSHDEKEMEHRGGLDPSRLNRLIAVFLLFLPSLLSHSQNVTAPSAVKISLERACAM